MTDRILLVEDDEALGRQVVGHLEGAGFSVRWIQDGDEAACEDPSPYSLAILDLMLPGAYGLDVLKRLRADSDLPVLILSARHDTNDKVRALELGADDFVTKPFLCSCFLNSVYAFVYQLGLMKITMLRFLLPSRATAHLFGTYCVPSGLQSLLLGS